MRHLPDDGYLAEAREEINLGLLRMIEKDSWPRTVEAIVGYHIAIDRHMLQLEEMLQQEMVRAKKLKGLYDDLLEQYSQMSDREMRMMEWIVKQKRRRSHG